MREAWPVRTATAMAVIGLVLAGCRASTDLARPGLYRGDAALIGSMLSTAGGALPGVHSLRHTTGNQSSRIDSPSSSPMSGKGGEVSPGRRR